MRSKQPGTIGLRPGGGSPGGPAYCTSLQVPSLVLPATNSDAPPRGPDSVENQGHGDYLRLVTARLPGETCEADSEPVVVRLELLTSRQVTPELEHQPFQVSYDPV